MGGVPDPSRCTAPCVAVLRPLRTREANGPTREGHEGARIGDLSRSCTLPVPNDPRFRQSSKQQR